jgi:hypothetical protein
MRENAPSRRERRCATPLQALERAPRTDQGHLWRLWVSLEQGGREKELAVGASLSFELLPSVLTSGGDLGVLLDPVDGL